MSNSFKGASSCTADDAAPVRSPFEAWCELTPEEAHLLHSAFTRMRRVKGRKIGLAALDAAARNRPAAFRAQPDDSDEMRSLAAVADRLAVTGHEMFFYAEEEIERAVACGEPARLPALLVGHVTDLLALAAEPEAAEALQRASGPLLSRATCELDGSA